MRLLLAHNRSSSKDRNSRLKGDHKGFQDLYFNSWNKSLFKLNQLVQVSSIFAWRKELFREPAYSRTWQHGHVTTWRYFLKNFQDIMNHGRSVQVHISIQRVRLPSKLWRLYPFAYQSKSLSSYVPCGGSWYSGSFSRSIAMLSHDRVVKFVSKQALWTTHFSKKICWIPWTSWLSLNNDLESSIWLCSF